MDGSDQHPANTQKIIAILLIIVLLGVTLPWLGLWIYANMQQINVAAPLEQIRVFDWSKLNPFNWWDIFYEKQMAIATGDYMSANIDENAKKQLGVRAAPVKSISPTYDLGEDVVVFATLNSESLGKQEINGQIACTSSKGPSGEITPSSSISLIGKQTQSVDCTFHELESGAHIITMTIDFDFSTLSYLPVLFASDELLRELARNEKDFFATYAPGQARQPVAISTEGPIVLGMGGEQQQPLALHIDKPEETYILGLTVQNKWDGYVKELKSLTVLAPRGFTLKSVTGSTGAPKRISCAQLKEGTSPGCDDENFAIYQVPIKAEKITTFKNYRTYFSADNPAQMLGSAPYVSRRFIAITDYTYEIEKKTTITVKAPELRTEPAPPPPSQLS